MTSSTRYRAEEGSDQEFYSVRGPRQEAEKEVEDKPEDILANIVKTDPDFSKPESKEVQAFNDKYSKSFKKQEARKSIREPGNILHVLASQSSKYWTGEKLVPFLRWVLQHHYAFLEEKTDTTKRYPLHVALLKENDAFIRTVIEFDGLKNIKTVLVQKRSHRNYIQLAIMTGSSLVADIARKCAELTLPVWNGSDTIGKESETPLHLAVRKVFLSYYPKLQLYEELLAKAGSREHSSVTEVYEKWKQEYVVRRRKKNARATKHTLADTDQPNGLVVDAIHGAETEADEPFDHVPREDVARLLLLLIKNYHQSQMRMSQVDLVKLFIELSQDSLERQSRKVDEKTSVEVRETPYQERCGKLSEAWDELVEALEKDDSITVDKNSLTEEEVIRMIIINDPVADTIRYHCLRHFDRDKIARCLYRPGDERHIDFDLAGLRSPSISNGFLKRLAKHLRFESILKYVALPKLALEDHSGDIEEKSQEKSQQSGRQDMTDLRAVFQWLRDNNVKRILKVTVVDYGSPCHSDAVIEKALESFQVEIWDWKKVDLCTDVISKSTTEARHVSLYSSCNNAVLMGWASSDGLGDRAKFSKLEHVRVFIAKGQEGNRRATYINDFERKIRDMTIPNSGGKKITVEHHLDDGKVSYAADFKNDEIPEQQEVEWINQVKGFSQFMRSIPRQEREKIAPIKIAIIDDGVDASLESVVGQIAGGKSFCPYASSSDLMNAYYVPSGQHGTMMADLICQICPSCRLYVARLDERPSRWDSSRQITIESAAEAVKWAVDCKVDIISMSWTIDGTSAEAKDVDKLESAIAEAKTDKILMFCSTSDHGSISSDNYYPAKTSECIRIGAATAFGDKCTWVPDQYDYLLPGKNVPFRWKRQDGVSSWYESGSSLATALAAGLAGLLLYCDRAVNGTGRDPVRKRSELHSRTGMMNLFRNLAVTSKDHKFLRADVWFNLKFRGYVQEKESRWYAGASAEPAPSSHYWGSTSADAPRRLTEMPWSNECKDALRRLLEEMKSNF